MAVKIKDIAKTAGVSVSTVSEILNNKERCYASEETKKRVKKIADDMGYVPNVLSRALKGLATGSIGIISNLLFDRELHNLLMGELSKEIYNNDYSLIFGDIHQSKANDLYILNKFISYGIDGLIVCSCKNPNLIKEATAGKLPVIFVDNGELFGNTYIDRHYGGYLAGKHFIDQGFLKAAFVSLSATEDNVKYQGLLKAFAESPTELQQPFIINLKDFKEQAEAVYQAYIDNKINAIFTESDRVAAAVMKYLVQKGVNIPADIAIIGFNGMPYTEFLNPALTSIRQPVDVLAQKSISLLLTMIKNKQYETMEKIAIKPELIIRESTSN